MTGGMSVPDEPDQVEASDADDGDRDARRREIRARLEARGLLTNTPEDQMSRSYLPLPPVTPPPSSPEVENHWAATEFDTWDVEPGDEQTVVRCPQCRAECTIPVEATRLWCGRCARAWRFAPCRHCGHLGLTVEQQESWRCTVCEKFSRSWWRTDTAPRLAVGVVARRRDQIVREERELALEGVRRRRWRLIVFALAAALVAVAVLILVPRSDGSIGPTGRTVACGHFRQMLEDIASGRLSQSGLDEELSLLERQVEGENERLRSTVADLRVGRTPTSPGFIAARAELVDQCEGAFG